MLKKGFFIVVLLTAMLVASLSAAAQFSGMLVGGVRTHDAAIDPYVSVELGLSNNLEIGFEYFHSRTGVWLWSGVNRGFYGEVHFAGNMMDGAEIGLWHDLNISDESIIYAWAGARRELSGSAATYVSLNAELRQALNNSVHLVAGAGTLLGNNTSNFNGWVGLGYGF